MPAKITKRLKALTLTERAKPTFFRIIKRTIKDLIRDNIEKGISPVEQRTAKKKNTGGKNRYQKYSDSYRRAMGKGDLANKKQSPRNLTLTGKMLNSLKVQVLTNSLKIWFSDEKAKYHNDEGAGKSKVIRRILPRDGERWARKIEKAIADALIKAIKLTQR
jgi:hypothetical protein